MLLSIKYSTIYVIAKILDAPRVPSYKSFLIARLFYLKDKIINFVVLWDGMTK